MGDNIKHRLRTENREKITEGSSKMCRTCPFNFQKLFNLEILSLSGPSTAFIMVQRAVSDEKFKNKILIRTRP